MEHWGLLEIYARLRAAEPAQRRSHPLPPPKQSFRTALRRRLARRLIGLGLCLDAEASRAAIGSFETAPQANGSDA